MTMSAWVPRMFWESGPDTADLKADEKRALQTEHEEPVRRNKLLFLDNERDHRRLGRREERRERRHDRGHDVDDPQLLGQEGEREEERAAGDVRADEDPA